MLTKLKSLRAVVQLLVVWWKTPVDYRTQTEYFAQRGLLDGVQLLIGACTALLASIPMIIQFSPSGPSTSWAHMISDAFAASAVVWTLAWWLGSWPSHRRSIAFIAYADIGITTVALMDADHLAGLFGINALALISLYAMFFEGPKVLALHSGWMSIALAVFGVVLATGPHGDPYLALSKSIAALASLVLTPAAVQFGIWLLRNDANDSITDHLTGLLNRRGLNLRFTGLLRKSKGTGTITVTLIDLDRFKSINDSEGHAVGDAVLVRCARRIADNVPASALVARIGGEEFVVVDVVSDREIPVLTERIRCAIAAPAEQAPVTASLGVVTVDVQTSQRRASNAETRLAAAIRCADQAMFESKGKGGNTVTVGLSEQWRTARMPVSGPVGAFGAFGADALAVGCEEIGLKGS